MGKFIVIGFKERNTSSTEKTILDARGNYLINEKDTLIINGSLAKHKAKIIQDSITIRLS